MNEIVMFLTDWGIYGIFIALYVLERKRSDERNQSREERLMNSLNDYNETLTRLSRRPCLRPRERRGEEFGE
jgi:hypothetical protein